MTGQKVQRFQGSTAKRYQAPPSVRAPKPARLTPDQRAASMLSGVFGSLMSQALSSGHSGGALLAQDPQAAALEARLAQKRQDLVQREQQALHAWAEGYAQRMNQQLAGQRLAPGGMEGLSATQSGLWDGGSRYASGDPMVVDLRDARALSPGLLRGGPPEPKPVTADEVLRRREEAQARLRDMMEENKDLNVLGQRFYGLEADLTRLKEEAAKLGSDGRAITREHEAWGAQVDRAVQNSLERGASLLTGTIIPDGTADGFKTLSKNPATYGSTMEAFAKVHDLTEFITERGDKVLAARDAVDWVSAKRNLSQDLDFVASNLQQVSKSWAPMAKQWELGKSIVGSGLDVAQELDAWAGMKGAAADHSLLKLRQQALQRQMTALVGQLQTSRAALAAQLGVRPEDLIPVTTAPKGLGSSVPRI